MKLYLISILTILFSLGSIAQEITPAQGQYLQSENILTNPGFESGRTGWTATGATVTSESTIVTRGKRSLKLVTSSQVPVLAQYSTSYQAQFADGLQGIATARIKTTHPGLKLCSAVAGVASTTNCVNVASDNKWGLYKVPFILGITSNGFVLSGSSGSGTTYIDDAFVGAVDLKQDTNNISDMTSYAAPQPTNANASGSYDYYRWKRVGDTVRVQLRWNATSAGSGSSAVAFPLPPNLATTDTLGHIGSSTTYNLVGSSNVFKTMGVGVFSGGIVINKDGTAGSVVGTDILNGTQIRLDAEFKVTGWAGSGSIYSSNNQDTDWASCGLTAADFGGMGTVTGIEVICKRQGSDLLMQGNFITGTVTAANATIAIPYARIIKSSMPVGVAKYGDGLRDAGGSAYAKGLEVLGTANGTSICFGVTGDGIASQPRACMAGNSILGAINTVSFKARVPIQGWENSNVIIGQFNGLESCKDSYDCTDTFSGRINGFSSSGAFSSPNLSGWITSCTRPTTGKYSCSVPVGVFPTAVPNCTGTVINPAAISRLVIFNSSSSTTTNLHFESVAGSTYENLDFVVSCQRAAPDYLSKTAKAVASDQNVRSIGSIGVDIQSVYFGGGASCTSACTTGSCTLCNPIGSKITSITWVSAGQYNVNGIDGLKYNCHGAYSNSGFAPIYHNRLLSAASYARIGVGINTTGENAAYASLTCTGIP